MTTSVYHPEQAPIATLKPYPRNARTHSSRQIAQIARSIERFGFTNPVLVDDDGMILAGHGRVKAALSLGMATVPIVRLSHMSEAEKRAYIIADNRLAEKAGWDSDLLAFELQGLIDLGFEVEITGFETAEIDLLLDEAAARDPDSTAGPEDDHPEPPKVAVSRPGDVWLLGRHRVICGDALDPAVYAALMGDERAGLVFTDPPYNVPVAGHVRVADGHREFAMASGEMTQDAFTSFLETSLGHAAAWSRDGAIAFVCMDWRHMGELLAAGRSVFTELKNVCVWAKTNGGMGSFYRSQHEMVFVFKHGAAPHVNTIELGRTGRYRTNVWSYPGVNVFKAGRGDELAMHPTVKPVALVEDAIKDASRRGDLVLDPFGGSGTTLIAAERCGRTARLVELDPLYVDVIVARYERYAGKSAKLSATGVAFDDLAEHRRADFS
jgi:DNA modification methylase